MNTKSTDSVRVSRREFLAHATAASALTALGQNATRAAGAARSGAGRVDCQSRLFCPEVVTLMEKRKTDPRVFMKDGVRGGTLPYIVVRLDHQVNVLKR